jgi:hypothetical protein
MTRIRALWLAALLAIPIVGIATAVSASAHVLKTFGTYSVAMGWLHEPTYAGELNAVQVIVKDAKGSAVTDLNDGDLKVQVSQAGKSTNVLPLNGTFDPDTGLGTPGEYLASIMPTVPGDYTFHLTGSIHGTAVDETATSSDSTFNTVKDASAIEFPTQPLTTTALSQNIVRVDGRVSTAQDASSSASTAAKSASDAATRANALAIVALALALLFGSATVVQFLRRRP